MSQEPTPFTRADAERHGAFVDDGDPIAECYVNGERCWTFAPTYAEADRERQFIEHAAKELGLCWSCSQPDDGWENRRNCERCWLMWHAEVGGLGPRDCPPFPGSNGRTEAL